MLIVDIVVPSSDLLSEQSKSDFNKDCPTNIGHTLNNLSSLSTQHLVLVMSSWTKLNMSSQAYIPSNLGRYLYDVRRTRCSRPYRARGGP